MERRGGGMGWKVWESRRKRGCREMGKKKLKKKKKKKKK
jgi:hypothetical protein